MPALAMCAAMPPPITPEPMTAALLMSMIGGSFSTAQTASRMVAMPWPPPMHWVARANAPPSRVEQLRRLAGDAGTGRPQRMAERQRAAVEVDAGVVEAELAAPPSAPGPRRPRCSR